MIVKKLPRYDENGLASFYLEANIIVLEVMDDGFWGRFEHEEKYPKSEIAVKIEGMGDKDRKILLKAGDKVKVIIKYEREKKDA